MKSYIGYTPQNNTSYAVQYQETFEFLFNNRDKAKEESKLKDLLDYSISIHKDYFGDSELDKQEYI